MSLIYGLPNLFINAIATKLLSNDNLVKYLYYTSKDDANIDIFAQKLPSIGDLIDKNIYIGRRIPFIVNEVGAWLGIRVCSYKPQYMKNGNLIKEVQANIDIICHNDCQKTLRGTRDITILTLVQDTLDGEDLEGIGEYRIISTSEILGLPVEYSGYTIKVETTGWSQNEKFK